jgi:hypothetical protein
LRKPAVSTVAILLAGVLRERRRIMLFVHSDLHAINVISAFMVAVIAV